MYLEAAADGSTNRLDRFTYDNYLCVARNRWQPDGTSATDRFVWDPTEPVATRPLAFYQPNAPPQLYAVDGNKNVAELVSSDDGTISAHYEYAPFGEVIISSGGLAFTNPFRFSSEYADDTIALVYYNYRHYEPVTGRWLQRDPTGEDASMSIYCFLYNDIGEYDVYGMRTSDKNKNIVCNDNSVGAIRAVSETSFSPSGYNPDTEDNKLKALIALLVLYDIPLPGSKASDLAVANIPGLPKGGSVAAEMFKNYKQMKNIFWESDGFNVWTRVKCQECECNRGLFWLRKPRYSWETFDESDWILCDIAKTNWGRRAKRWRGSPVNDDFSLKFYMLSFKDRKEICRQCEEQAEKMCDKYKNIE